MTSRKTTADQVRTGDTIVTDWSPRGFTLTVYYPTRDRFTSPEGAVLDRIRFTGVDNHGQHVHEGWGVRARSRVHVVEDAPLKADMPGSGVFGAVADDEPVFDPEAADLESSDGDELL